MLLQYVTVLKALQRSLLNMMYCKYILLRDIPLQDQGVHFPALPKQISWFEDSPVLVAVHCSVRFMYMCMNVCVCVNARMYMYMYMHKYVKEMYCFLTLRQSNAHG